VHAWLIKSLEIFWVGESGPENGLVNQVQKLFGL